MTPGSFLQDGTTGTIFRVAKHSLGTEQLGTFTHRVSKLTGCPCRCRATLESSLRKAAMGAGPMNIELHYRSLTVELESLKDRVRNFIDSGYWPTVGEWKESVLRSILAKRLPETVRIERGFVLTRGGATTQCDVLCTRQTPPCSSRMASWFF